MKRTVQFLSLLSFVGVGFAFGCNVESPDGNASESDDVSAASRSYVTLRRDTRACAAPKCGGYYAKNVNQATSAEKYVSALDFSAADLDAATIADVKDAADGEVVIYGKLSAIASNGTQKLLVTAAYRGMPGFGPATGDLFYGAGQRSPQITCFTAPCNNLTAKKLNATAPTTNYTRTEIEIQHRLQIDYGSPSASKKAERSSPHPSARARKKRAATKTFSRSTRSSSSCRT